MRELLAQQELAVGADLEPALHGVLDLLDVDGADGRGGGIHLYIGAYPRIEDNVIEDTAGPAIHVYQADDVVIARNRIERANQIPAPQAGSRIGLTTNGPVCVDHSTHVRVEP